jgi:hypothetical protein
VGIKSFNTVKSNTLKKAIAKPTKGNATKREAYTFLFIAIFFKPMGKMEK